MLTIGLASACRTGEPVQTETTAGDMLNQSDYLDKLVPLLKHLSDSKHQSGEQMFYVSKAFVSPDGTRHVWIYWPKMEHLVFYSGDTYNIEQCNCYYELRTKKGICKYGDEYKGKTREITEVEFYEYSGKCERGDKLIVR